MQVIYRARQSAVSLSQCQRLCGRSSTYVDEVAGWAGASPSPLQPLNADIGRAINMLALTEAANAGVEYRAMAPWLPALRNGALIYLGKNFENWHFEGTESQRQAFYFKFFDNRDALDVFVGGLLGCCLHSAKRQLRFHSQSDVEVLSNSELSTGHIGRTPRLVLDSHGLADRIVEVCGRPAFTAYVI